MAQGWRICAQDFTGEWICTYTEKNTAAEAFVSCVTEFPPSAKFENHMVRGIEAHEEYYLLINLGRPPDEIVLPRLIVEGIPDDVLPL